MKLWLYRAAAGCRMDVSFWVPDDFWREWRSAIKTPKPDALTVVETSFDASKYCLGGMFDSTMNYVLRSAVLEVAAGGNARTLYAHAASPTRPCWPSSRHSSNCAATTRCCPVAALTHRCTPTNTSSSGCAATRVSWPGRP